MTWPFPGVELFFLTSQSQYLQVNRFYCPFPLQIKTFALQKRERKNWSAFAVFLPQSAPMASHDLLEYSWRCLVRLWGDQMRAV
jgi:hypothetical protein